MTRALIRKTPYCLEYQQEVYLEPWLPWMDTDTGAPLTDENYGYALCNDIPDDVDIFMLTVDDFTVTEQHVDEPDPYGEGTISRRVLTATYNVK